MNRRSFVKVSSVMALVSVAGYKFRTLFKDVTVKAEEVFGLSFPATFPITFQESPSGGVDEHIVHFPFISRD